MRILINVFREHKHYKRANINILQDTKTSIKNFCNEWVVFLAEPVYMKVAFFPTKEGSEKC